MNIIQLPPPKIYEGIPMRSPENGGYGVLTGDLLLPHKTSSSRTGLYSIELVAMENPKQFKLSLRQ